MGPTTEADTSLAESNCWREVNGNGDVPRKRYGHAVALVRYPRSRLQQNGDSPVTTGIDEGATSNVPGPTSASANSEEVVEVIVLFGSDHTILHDVYSFDPKTSHWSELQVKVIDVRGNESNLHDAQLVQQTIVAAHPSIAAAGEDIYIFGGVSDNDECHLQISNSLARFNAPTRTLHILLQHGVQLGPRLGASLTYIPDWRTGPALILFGGITPNRKTLNDTYLFNIRRGRWETLAVKGKPPTPRESHSADLWRGKSGKESKIVIFGGMNDDWRKPPEYGRLNDVAVLDLDGMQWVHPKISGIQPSGRSLHTACLVNQKLYIFGGVVVRKEAELWDDAYELHSFATAAEMEGLKIFRTTDDLYTLDLDSWKWNMIEAPAEGPHPLERANFGACQLDHVMYIFGGVIYDTSGKTTLGDQWRLDVGPPLSPGPLLILSPGIPMKLAWSDAQSWDGWRQYRVYVRKNGADQTAWDLAYKGSDMEITLTDFESSEQRIAMVADEEYTVRLVAFNGAAESSAQEAFQHGNEIIVPHASPRAPTSTNAVVVPYIPKEFGGSEFVANSTSGPSSGCLCFEWEHDAQEGVFFEVQAACHFSKEGGVKENSERVIKRRKQQDALVISVNNSPQEPYNSSSTYGHGETKSASNGSMESSGADDVPGWKQIWVGNSRRFGKVMSEVHREVAAAQTSRQGWLQDWRHTNKRKRGEENNSYTAEYRFRIRARAHGLVSDWYEHPAAVPVAIRPQDFLSESDLAFDGESLNPFLASTSYRPMSPADSQAGSIKAPSYSPITTPTTTGTKRKAGRSISQEGDLDIEGFTPRSPIDRAVPQNMSPAFMDEEEEEEEEDVASGSVQPWVALQQGGIISGTAVAATPSQPSKPATSASRQKGDGSSAKAAKSKARTSLGGTQGETSTEKQKSSAKRKESAKDGPVSAKAGKSSAASIKRHAQKISSTGDPFDVPTSPTKTEESPTPSRPRKPSDAASATSSSSTKKKSTPKIEIPEVRVREGPPIEVKVRDAAGRPVLGGEDNSFHFNLPYGTHIQLISLVQPTALYYSAHALYYTPHGEKEWALKVYYDGFTGKVSEEAIPLVESEYLKMEMFSGQDLDEDPYERSRKKPAWDWDPKKAGAHKVVLTSQETKAAFATGKCIVVVEGKIKRKIETVHVYGEGEGEGKGAGR
ncbi:hypothetical protein HDV00_012066 [Rhizophlyctis rosea]|nr:hypothetical protein HDV00_012066 [Rhizophlyctis rosea]